jgi:hypothetical protein
MTLLKCKLKIKNLSAHNREGEQRLTTAFLRIQAAHNRSFNKYERLTTALYYISSSTECKGKIQKLVISPDAISRDLPHFNLGKVAKLSARYNKSHHIAAYCVWWHFKIDSLAKNVLF